MSKAADLANLIGNINAGGGGVNRNLVINGAMNVAQRGTSSTGLGASGGYFTVDRAYLSAANTAGRLTMTQDGSGPSGFANSLKLACTTADTSIAANELVMLQHNFEGQNLQTLNKGTSSAVPVSVSFYVKGNASATYVCELYDYDNARQISQTFNVTTDWTRVELTFVADTTGALDDDNALSFALNIVLHAGSNFTSGTLSTTWTSVTSANRHVGISSFFDSTSRTFFLTGLQMEVGQNPTEFEHEPVERTLSKCQRYYFKFLEGATKEIGPGWFYNATYMSTIFRFPTTMRATPTATSTSGTNMYIIYRENAGDGFDDLTFENGSTEQYSAYNSDEVGSATAGAAGIVRSHPSAGGSAKVEFAAEL